MKPKYTLYKSDISYFSGKLESYLSYKEIPHKVVDCNNLTLEKIGKKTGTRKMPAIEMTNGTWLYDTTTMMQWLEEKHTHAPVLPEDPALRFLALLIEDYADEWLWRPAMWWRWVPKISRTTVGRKIASDMIGSTFSIPLGFYFGRRQLKHWVYKDGVNRKNEKFVKNMLFRELEFLEALLAKQDFILGNQPSMADFGFFGPMFRHFGNDPVSAEVVRREAPRTHEWLANMWRIKHSKLEKPVQWLWPKGEHWKPLLQRIAQDYLPYLHQNALAFKADKERFDFKGINVSFPQTVTTHYRVWCREQLQKEFATLSGADIAKLEQLFADAGCGLASLHADGVIPSHLDKQLQLPINPKKVKYKATVIQRLLGQPRN